MKLKQVLNVLTRVLALMVLVAAVVTALSGDYAQAAYLAALATFNQLLAQEE